ncbi:MAG: hypothetical protein DMG14_18715 [Acidobacteria bacterium]|nr:MAG: hypothetical protein DMG14_18715 [Acidobacteriota bacterium]
MKTFLNAFGLILMLALLSPSLSAQWPSYPTPGVPKGPDGMPNLAGPAPRTADGKPDLSGIWSNIRPPAGQRGQGAAATPPPPPPPPPPGTPPVATFRDVGAGFKEGLPLQPWAAEVVKKRMADNSKDNPDAHCLPMGNMQFHTHGQPRKVVQTPGMIYIIYEANSGLRQIFTDGRTLPSKDPDPWWYGYSVGKWEGDTLIVETIGFRDDGWLDINGNPLTSAGKTIERFRRPNYGTLEIDVTVDDPKAYTRPWTVRVNQRIMLDTELIEFICEDRDATHYVGAK